MEPNHNYGNVSGMCGVTSASSPVFVFKDKVHGNTSTNWMQTDHDLIRRLLMREELRRSSSSEKLLAPVMAATIKHAGGFNVKELLGQGTANGGRTTWVLRCHPRGVHELDSSPYCKNGFPERRRSGRSETTSWEMEVDGSAAT